MVPGAAPAMSYLEDLPCRNPENFMKNIVAAKKDRGKVTKSLGMGRLILCTQSDATPEFDQIITTDTTNLLLRYLFKQSEHQSKSAKYAVKEESSPKDVSSPSSERESAEPAPKRRKVGS
ncbi:uncharacterized protein LOC126332388 [Schistocerca gregaria]|uniref:uncharacterized protein LOC126332388 n=1 Tax=Schistocerca gregaria TaxID=7010 RepID=UPI00211E19A4|nr:uncharacterized protein LOC126332388 [Schistocerca gregaria]